MTKINKKNDLKATLSFGFEQTFTIKDWWTDPGFTATSDTPLKRKMMLALTQELVGILNGSYKESLDIWDHLQYETFDSENNPSFIVTMDPGSIEVKTQPCLAHKVEAMITPLFTASKKANLVPYRFWWYGVKGGTEGGCHVNMGGLSPETNPFIKDPDLVVKYAAFIHNRPFLHYPFMGLDVGPEGNAMRMDEKDGFDKVKKAFYSYHEELNPSETYNHFKNTNLISNKSSFPSLYKFKEPLFLIEDRGQEALRSPEDFKLVVELRLLIFDLLSRSSVEKLKDFSNSLHKEELTSYYLWGEFQIWANQNNLNPVPYQRFFERQFPILQNGENLPSLFGLREGRRPRVITDIKRNGETIISKTIDTSYKRFELFAYAKENSKVDIAISADGIEVSSQTLKHVGYLGLHGTGQAFYKYVDVKINKENPILSIKVRVDEKEERSNFHLLDMKWI